MAFPPRIVRRCAEVTTNAGGNRQGDERRAYHFDELRLPASIASVAFKCARASRVPNEKGAAVRIIVTGGAGFIGSHIAEAFLTEGHDVLVLDSLWEHGGGRRTNVPPRATFVHMDIRDEGLTRI